MDLSNTEWTWQEFREAMGGRDDEVLHPMLDICNTAIRHGLTRDQVADALGRLSRSHPEVLPAQVLIDALAEEAYPIVQPQVEGAGGLPGS